MILDARTIRIALLCIAIGWWLGSSPSSPVNPHPEPDRPVLTALVRIARVAARLGLWAAFAADPPTDTRQAASTVRTDADGHQVVDHAEGW